MHYLQQSHKENDAQHVGILPLREHFSAGISAEDSKFKTVKCKEGKKASILNSVHFLDINFFFFAVYVVEKSFFKSGLFFRTERNKFQLCKDSILTLTVNQLLLVYKVNILTTIQQPECHCPNMIPPFLTPGTKRDF